MRKALVKRGNKVIEVDIDDNYVNQLQKAQDGKQLPKPVYDEYGVEIISSKHRNRNGKDFQKYRKYDPDSGREYIEKQFFNPNTNKIESSVRDKGSLYRGYSTRDAIAPNPFIDIEQYINPYRTNFNQQPTMFQMGGVPQQQMAQQQMPPQQEGQASEQDQIMQLIQAYAASMQVSPEEIIQELQQMNPQEQQAAIQQMAQELQGEQEQAPQQEMAPEQMMQRGGTKPIYTPDTGIEQYAPDTSWYDGGDQVAAPGNVVSFPSYPEQGTNALARFIPVENQYNTQQPPPRRGTGITTFNDSSYDQGDRDSSYDEYNPVRRVPFLENLGDRIGDGFDNVGDFFKRLRKNRRRRRGSRGNGLFSCKPGTDCYRHKEGGVTNGQYPIDYYMPESKLKTFIDLAQGYGQENYDNAFMNNLDETIKKKDYFQIGGYITNEDGSQSYDLGSGYDPNKLSRAYAAQNNASNLSKKGDTFGAIANATQTFANNVGTNLNNAYKIAKVAAPIAANVIAPGSGALVKAGMNAMDKPKDGATAGGFDPSSLMSMFAKFGGNLPKYQIDGQFSSGIGSFGNSPAWNFGNTGVENFIQRFEQKNPQFGNQVQPAPIQNITMADQSLNTPIDFGPQDDPITTNATNPNKDKELINGPTQKQPKGFTNPLLGIAPAIAGIFEAAGNAKKARRAQNQADRALLSDNLFASTDINRGDYVTNTQPNTGNFRPDDNVVMGLNASQKTKYGAQIAKDGAQISNPYMSNSNSESTLYGESEREISNTLKPVKRDLANLEAEIGEVAITPGGADGIPKFFKIGGKNHYDGGTPLSLPENTFIYSKTKSMIIKDPKILKELTGSTKPASPAELAKKFDYSEYIAVLQNKNTDPVERKTAEIMIENMINKLGQIAIIQEAKKGFPSGIPLIAGPYLEKAGIDPQMLLPKTEDPELISDIEQQVMDDSQQMDPRMMQEQMEPIPPMQKGGNKSISRPTPVRSNVQQGSNSVLSSGYNRNLNNTQFGSRIINEYGNGLPNDTSYIYQSPNEDYFYNTGQNTQDGRPVSNYNSGSDAPLDAAAYQSMIRKLAGYAYGGSNLERYQSKGEVDRNPAQQVISLLTGRGSIQKPNDEATGYWDRVAKNWSNVEFTSDWNDPRSDPRVAQAAKELIPFNGSDGVLDYFGNMFTVPQKTANMLLTGLYESPMTTVSRTSQMDEGEKLLGDIVTDPMIIPEIPYAIGKGLYKGATAGFKAAVPFAQKAAINTALAGMRVAEITTELAAKYGPKLIKLASKYIGKIPPERMVLVASRVSQAVTQATNNRTPVDLDVLFQKEIDKEMATATTPKTLTKPKPQVNAPATVRTPQQAPKPAVVAKSTPAPVQVPVQQKSPKSTTTKSKSTSTQTTIPTTSSNSGLMKLTEGEYNIVR